MKFILNSPKAIANDPEREGELVRNEAGTELSFPGRGLTLDEVKQWIADGHATEIKADAPAAKSSAAE